MIPDTSKWCISPTHQLNRCWTVGYQADICFKTNMEKLNNFGEVMFTWTHMTTINKTMKWDWGKRMHVLKRCCLIPMCSQNPFFLYELGPGSSYECSYKPYKWPKINPSYARKPGWKSNQNPMTSQWSELNGIPQVFSITLYCWCKKSGEHQVRLVVYPIIYRVLHIPGGDRRISEPSAVFLPISGQLGSTQT